MTRVLYIDDESALLTLTQIYLKEEADLDVEISSSAEEGLAMLKASAFDAIISDYDMPDMDGIEFLKHVREYDLSIPFIVFTGKGREEVAIEALNNGADFYIQKGGEPRTLFAELANAIRHLVRRSNAERNATLTEQQLKVFLDSLSDLAFIKGPDMALLYANTAYMNYLGLSSIEEIIGKTDDQVLPAKLFHMCRISDEQVLHKNQPVSTQEIFDGRIYHVQKFPLPFPNGMTGVGGIIRDVTDVAHLVDHPENRLPGKNSQLP
jgi:PAS domain S-box-containing protein